MSANEKDLLNRISQEIDSADDLMAFSRFQAEHLERRRRRKIQFFSFIFSAYIAIAFMFLFFIKDGSVSPFLNHGKFNDDKLMRLESSFNELSYRFNEISLNEGVISTSTDIANLNNRLSQLEDVIEYDAEKAMTAVMLREQQRMLSSELAEIKSNQQQIESRFFDLILFVIAVPAISALLAFVAYIFRKKIFNDVGVD